MRRPWGIALVAASLIACSRPTQLLVVVDSDLEPLSEVHRIDVSIAAASGAASVRTFELSEVALPFSFGIRPSYADDEPVRIALAARGPNGSTVVQLHRMTRFLPGEIRVLEAPLARSCAGEPTCRDADATCVRGMCVREEVDAASLPSPSGAEPMPLFDGPRAAPDGGVDAGPTCVTGSPCETGDPCQIGALLCGNEPRCEIVGTLAPGTDCGAGRVCDGEGRCGAPR